jgi:nicotinamidase-related amidase
MCDGSENGKKSTTEKNIPVAALSAAQSHVDVCIFIDPLYDFLSPEGVFCKTYGEEDCAPILSVHKSLNNLYHHLKSECPSVDIIIVSSVYEATQFETVPNLCTTPEGYKVLLDDCPVDENNRVCGNHTYIQKTANSFFSCTDEDRERIQQLCAHRHILVCGVTTVSCVSVAVSNLLDNTTCRKVLVARNAVASRRRNTEREASLLGEWGRGAQHRVEVHDEWEQLLPACMSGVELLNDEI